MWFLRLFRLPLHSLSSFLETPRYTPSQLPSVTYGVPVAQPEPAREESGAATNPEIPGDNIITADTDIKERHLVIFFVYVLFNLSLVV